jgi:hypothetical protein
MTDKKVQILNSTASFQNLLKVSVAEESAVTGKFRLSKGRIV